MPPSLENDQIREEFRDAKAQGEVNEEYFATRMAEVKREGACQDPSSPGPACNGRQVGESGN